MNYFIITGTSRGLGQALAKKLLQTNNNLICLSRKRNTALMDYAKEKGCPLRYIPCDLGQVDQLDEIVDQIFEGISLKKGDSIYLINNAGTVNPIGPAENNKAADISDCFHINTLAPIILTSKFISKTTHYDCIKRVLNISSGAGRNPYDGWSCYCSTKAAVDMFTKCVAIEQEKRVYPVQIMSLAPGVIDTDMQSVIRQSSENDFSQLEKFIGLKESGRLMSPDLVAEKIIDLILSRFVQGGILDIRDETKVYR